VIPPESAPDAQPAITRPGSERLTRRWHDQPPCRAAKQAARLAITIGTGDKHRLTQPIPRQRAGLDHDPAQLACLARIEVGARMVHAAVVPDHHVTGLPLVGVDELRLLLVLEQPLEQLRAFLARHADDKGGHQPVHVQRLAAGGRVGDHHRMRGGQGIGRGLDARERDRVLRVVTRLVGMYGLEPGNALLHVFRQRVVGLVLVRETGVATLRRDVDAVEHRAQAGTLDMAAVGMEVHEVHLTVGQCTDVLAETTVWRSAAGCNT
jgi:hypothetical protein